MHPAPLLADMVATEFVGTAMFINMAAMHFMNVTKADLHVHSLPSND